MEQFCVDLTVESHWKNLFEHTVQMYICNLMNRVFLKIVSIRKNYSFLCYSIPAAKHLAANGRHKVAGQRWEFIKQNKNSTKKLTKKKRKFFLFFLDAFLVKSVFYFSVSCFLDRFLGRVLVFLFSYFLVFFYKFPPLDVLFCMYVYIVQDKSLVHAALVL